MTEHREVAALLPWFVNGTLSEADRRRVDAHLSLCARCRDGAAAERALFERIRGSDNAVEYLPTASLQRFNARLSAAESAPNGAPRVSPPRAWRMPRALAAAVAVIALALGVWTVTGRQRSGVLATPPHYRTVTTPENRPSDEVIRAVFAPQVTVVELQTLLAAAQLKIVSGPSEAGVYSLAAISTRPVDDSLAMLRRQPTVRFAERTRSEAATTGLP